MRCDRWGAFALGPLLVRSRDRLGFHSWEAQVGAARPLRVYPSVETLRTMLAPLETQVFIGNQTSRTKGDGIEFADIREWAPGDRVRSINWRATARRGELHVNQQHPERNTDVVLFLDTFTDVGDGRSQHARHDGARRDVARASLPRAEGPRRARELRRLSLVARCPRRARSSSIASSTRCCRWTSC